MMTPSLWFVLLGCVLGLAQLFAGIAIGVWLRRQPPPAEPDRQPDFMSATRIAERLRTLAGEVSANVGEHQQQIEAASQKLTSDCIRDNELITELVVDVIGGIVRANHQLQSQLSTAEHRLQEQAEEIQAHISRSLTDPLTGLPNRREFNQRLEERMAGWNRRGEVFSLLFLDVDRFKNLNDHYGHLVGDDMLTALGRTLRSTLRRDDAIARFGGEEFAMILPGTVLEQAVAVLPKISEAASRATVLHGNIELSVTLSGGLATIRVGETTESLIRRADEALYAAKSAGRNRVYLHDGDCCRPATKSDDGGDSEGLSDGLSLGFELTADGAISPELAMTCQELRQFMEEQNEAELQAASGR